MNLTFGFWLYLVEECQWHTRWPGPSMCQWMFLSWGSLEYPDTKNWPWAPSVQEKRASLTKILSARFAFRLTSLNKWRKSKNLSSNGERNFIAVIDRLSTFGDGRSYSSTMVSQP